MTALKLRKSPQPHSLMCHVLMQSSAMDIGRRMAVSVRRCGICDGELADNATHLTPGHSAGTNGANGSVQVRPRLHLEALLDQGSCRVASKGSQC